MFIPTQQSLPGGMGCYSCGLGCPGCGGKCGLGSFDFSSFTWEDWMIVGIVGAVLFNINPSTVRSKGRKARKKASSAVSTIGLVAGLGVLGYVGYQVWNGGTALGAQLAGSGA